jgi:hypothetical protein
VGRSFCHSHAKAGERLKQQTELSPVLEEAYEAYLKSPGDQGLLAKLEELEEMDAQLREYTAFGGDSEN